MEKDLQRKPEAIDDILVGEDKKVPPSTAQGEDGEPRTYTLEMDDFYLAEKAGGKLAVVSHKLRTWGVEARGMHMWSFTESN